jgi:hypothetical protein
MHANYLGREGYYNAGIWPHSSINFVTQFNEVAYTHLEHGVEDGEGLDVDIGCINTLVQYNYVHHNDGGGILICNNRSVDGIGNHQGTVIRNNVFFDNGRNESRATFLTIFSAIQKMNVYNNTVIVTNRHSDVNFVMSADWANIGKSKDIIFRNNIFVATEEVSAHFDLSQITNCVFDNNLVYRIGSIKSVINDNHLLSYDPAITIPTIPDGYENGLKFRSADFNTFTSGSLFTGMLDTDMAGYPTKNERYIGAFCK